MPVTLFTLKQRHIMKKADSIYQFTVRDISQQSVSLDKYQNQLLLIVNTASHCGFTPQYQGLEALYQKYKDQGFEILAFPCNQFGAQEPGDNQTIANFCETNYQISFPLMDKVKVNGEDAAELFKFLKASAPGLLGSEAIKWNFTKFLVGRDGQLVKRFAPQDSAEKIEKTILNLL